MSNQEQEPQPERPTIHPESLVAIRRQEERIAQLRRVIADYQSVAVGYEKELAEAKAAAGIAVEPQPEHIDTLDTLHALDVLQAIVDAWRHLDRVQGPVCTTMGLREFLTRQETLAKALEMGRRHLEQEGRL